MSLDYATLEILRRQHPAWRLLLAEHAALIASFLHKAFVLPNVRMKSAADLAEALEDELFGLREQSGNETFPRSAMEYLNEWTANEKGWLRKHYPPGSDEAHFELTPATERTIAWLASLAKRPFVGTESRLLTLFDLLRQMSEGSEADPQARIRELIKRRADIDGEIARIQQGDVPLLDSTALKERFIQFAGIARELLADFREVEQNFRALDRSVRERIAQWEGAKGSLLREIMGERDLIAESDQGRSFRAFWDFLMSQARQEELTHLLDRVLELPSIAELSPDIRMRRVHYDWLDAGNHTQRTVALLSQQLRRFLDDQAYLESRRIMEILRNIEIHAVAVRENAPTGVFMWIADTAADLDLPMERPLHAPPLKPLIADVRLETGDEAMDAAVLFAQFVVDKEALAAHIRRALQDRTQVTLRELLDLHPMQQGLAELVAYLQLAVENTKAMVDEAASDTVTWQTPDGFRKQARLNRVVFLR
jgi:flagellar motility protein MotE (MotC chaperone)